MKKYIIHIFNVDENGIIIPESIQVHTIECDSDEKAVEQGETLRQLRNKKEPLPKDKFLGDVEYLCDVWNTDEFGNEYKII